MKWQLPILLLISMTLGASGQAEKYKERIRLYTKPDTESTGGIKGRVKRPGKPILQALAIPPDDPAKVYRGEVFGDSSDQFEFKGLPMRKYDLILIFDTEFYDGLQLTRSKNSLTTKDRQGIEKSIQKSEPFFTYKTVHRLEGQSGQGNTARALCTFYRKQDDPEKSVVQSISGYRPTDLRRTFKLLMLKQVGPGWQITRARDLYPVWINKELLTPKHIYNDKLSRIRVTDYVKDLGVLDLK